MEGVSFRRVSGSGGLNSMNRRRRFLGKYVLETRSNAGFLPEPLLGMKRQVDDWRSVMGSGAPFIDVAMVSTAIAQSRGGGNDQLPFLETEVCLFAFTSTLPTFGGMVTPQHDDLGLPTNP